MSTDEIDRGKKKRKGNVNNLNKKKKKNEDEGRQEFEVIFVISIICWSEGMRDAVTADDRTEKQMNPVEPQRPDQLVTQLM